MVYHQARTREQHQARRLAWLKQLGGEETPVGAAALAHYMEEGRQIAAQYAHQQEQFEAATAQNATQQVQLQQALRQLQAQKAASPAPNAPPAAEYR